MNNGHRDDVIIGTGDDAACLTVPQSKVKVLMDFIDMRTRTQRVHSLLGPI